MLRSHTCGELNLKHLDKEVILSGWVQKSRDLGGMTFVDLRDRYGITQLVFNMETDEALCLEARKLGREYVIQVKGKVIERSSKNKNIPTGEIEIEILDLNILNASKTPPFTIENETDGGDDLRMKYRYLDLRRNPIRENMILRSKVAIETRKYLADQNFIEVETPVLIKSTPEGARDFVVPSRMNEGQFYALPQSPQTFKQLLMVSGFDKYFQIVKCFRDEDLRADRQPEFTQIDCEMSFVEQDDILNTFENLTRHLLKTVINVELKDFPRMTFDEAMRDYGNDKPDIRFDMKLKNINAVAQNKGFKVFDEAELVLAINAKGCAGYTRKQLDKLTDWVKRPQIGAALARGAGCACRPRGGRHETNGCGLHRRPRLRRGRQALYRVLGAVVPPVPLAGRGAHPQPGSVRQAHGRDRLQRAFALFVRCRRAARSLLLLRPRRRR